MTSHLKTDEGMMDRTDPKETEAAAQDSQGAAESDEGMMNVTDPKETEAAAQDSQGATESDGGMMDVTDPKETEAAAQDSQGAAESDERMMDQTDPNENEAAARDSQGAAESDGGMMDVTDPKETEAAAQDSQGAAELDEGITDLTDPKETEAAAQDSQGAAGLGGGMMDVTDPKETEAAAQDSQGAAESDGGMMDVTDPKETEAAAQDSQGAAGKSSDGETLKVKEQNDERTNLNDLIKRMKIFENKNVLPDSDSDESTSLQIDETDSMGNTSKDKEPPTPKPTGKKPAKINAAHFIENKKQMTDSDYDDYIAHKIAENEFIQSIPPGKDINDKADSDQDSVTEIIFPVELVDLTTIGSEDEKTESKSDNAVGKTDAKSKVILKRKNDSVAPVDFVDLTLTDDGKDDNAVKIDVARKSVTFTKQKASEGKGADEAANAQGKLTVKEGRGFLKKNTVGGNEEEEQDKYSWEAVFNNMASKEDNVQVQSAWQAEKIRQLQSLSNVAQYSASKDLNLDVQNLWQAAKIRQKESMNNIPGYSAPKEVLSNWQAEKIRLNQAMNTVQGYSGSGGGSEVPLFAIPYSQQPSMNPVPGNPGSGVGRPVPQPATQNPSINNTIQPVMNPVPGYSGSGVGRQVPLLGTQNQSMNNPAQQPVMNPVPGYSGSEVGRQVNPFPTLSQSINNPAQQPVMNPVPGYSGSGGLRPIPHFIGQHPLINNPVMNLVPGSPGSGIGRQVPLFPTLTPSMNNPAQQPVMNPIPGYSGPGGGRQVPQHNFQNPPMNIPQQLVMNPAPGNPGSGIGGQVPQFTTPNPQQPLMNPVPGNPGFGVGRQNPSMNNQQQPVMNPFPGYSGGVGQVPRHLAQNPSMNIPHQNVMNPAPGNPGSGGGSEVPLFAIPYSQQPSMNPGYGGGRQVPLFGTENPRMNNPMQPVMNPVPGYSGFPTMTPEHPDPWQNMPAQNIHQEQVMNDEDLGCSEDGNDFFDNDDTRSSNHSMGLDEGEAPVGTVNVSYTRASPDFTQPEMETTECQHPGQIMPPQDIHQAHAMKQFPGYSGHGSGSTNIATDRVAQQQYQLGSETSAFDVYNRAATPDMPGTFDMWNRTPNREAVPRPEPSVYGGPPASDYEMQTDTGATDTSGQLKRAAYSDYGDTIRPKYNRGPTASNIHIEAPAPRMPSASNDRGRGRGGGKRTKKSTHTAATPKMPGLAEDNRGPSPKLPPRCEIYESPRGYKIIRGSFDNQPKILNTPSGRIGTPPKMTCTSPTTQSMPSRSTYNPPMFSNAPFSNAPRNVFDVVQPMTYLNQNNPVPSGSFQAPPNIPLLSQPSLSGNRNMQNMQLPNDSSNVFMSQLMGVVRSEIDRMTDRMQTGTHVPRDVSITFMREEEHQLTTLSSNLRDNHSNYPDGGNDQENEFLDEHRHYQRWW